MRNQRAVYVDVGWYGLSKLIPGLAGLVGVSLLVRVLRSEDYGAYALASSAANAASVIASAWLAQGINRFLPMAKIGGGIPNAVGFLAKTALVVSLFVSFLAIFASAPGLGLGALLASGMLAAAQSGHTISCAILMARLRANVVATIEAGRSVLAVVLIGALFLWPSSRYILAVLILGFSYVVSSLVGAAFAHRELLDLTRATELDRRIRYRAMREIVSYGIPMSIWLAAFTLLPFLDRTLVELNFGRAVTGEYAVYYEFIVRGSGFFIMPVVLAVQPRVMTLFGESKFEEVAKLLRHALLATLGSTALVTLGIFIFGPLLTQKALGLHGHVDRVFLACLALGGCLWQVGLITHKMLEAEGKTMILISSMLTACLLAFLVNLVKLPQLGIKAAGYALVAGSSVYALTTGCVSVRLMMQRLESSPFRGDRETPKGSS